MRWSFLKQRPHIYQTFSIKRSMENDMGTRNLVFLLVRGKLECSKFYWLRKEKVKDPNDKIGK